MWNELTTLVSTISTAVVLFGLFVLRPVAERLFLHRERLRLRQQKADALLAGRDPFQLDPDYLEHLQAMRLRDAQIVALQHGYDPRKLDPEYNPILDKEDGQPHQEVPPQGQPHDEYQQQYVQGYQVQPGRQSD